MRWVALAFTAIVFVLLAVAWQHEERPRTPARAPGATRPAEVAPAPEPAEHATEEPEPSPLTVRFTVGFLGSERAVGRVRAAVWALDRDAEAIPVTTDDGTFEITLPAPGRYRLGDIEIDGEEIPHYSRDLLVINSDAIEILVPEARDVTLVVVDAKDGRPVADVMVHDYVASWEWDLGFEPGHRIPGPRTLGSKPRRTDRSGRLALGKGRGAASVYLFAEGYAWTAVSIPFDAGDEIVVELERGGAVRLVVPGWNELRKPRVWARRVMSFDDFRVLQPDKNGVLLLDGLLGDDYAFTVRRGQPWDEGKVYGTGEISVRAGETGELTVHVKPEVTLPKVRVTGTLTVPATWKERPTWMTFEGFEEANAEIDETVMFFRPPYRYETKPIPPGQYVVEVRPYLWGRRVTVSDRGERFDFELPHPVTVRVTVVDAEGGRRIPGATLMWRVPMPGGSSSSSSWIRPDSASDLLVFQAPPGTVWLEAEAPGYYGYEQTVDADENRDVTVRLDEGGVVVVRLRLNGRPFDGAGMRVTVETSDRHFDYPFENGVARLDTVEPGDYEVKLSDVAGCAAVPAQRVEVKAGRTHEVLFDLKRKPVPEEAER